MPKKPIKDVFLKHQVAIARKTLKMSDAMVGVMGGMTKYEARSILARVKKQGYKV